MEESPYRVVYLRSALREFKQNYLRAKKLGLGDDVLDAGMEIDRQLRQDPVQFGDPTFSLLSMKLQFFSRAFAPLVVRYAVHQEQNLVFVTRLVAFF